MTEFAIYDMDRTITRTGTFTPFLMHAALNRAPWRLVLAPFVLVAMLGYTLKFITEESIGIVSLLSSKVFERFPTLKLVFPHGGGAIPYHMGRFRAWAVRNGGETYDQMMRRLHFDTTTYDKNAIELLIKTVGADRVLFATEKPGTGSARDPASGRDFDDLKPVIEEIEFLSDEDRRNIFECNCTRLYNRFKVG